MDVCEDWSRRCEHLMFPSLLLRKIKQHFKKFRKNTLAGILRLRPGNFVIISESLAANLEKGRPLYDKRFQSSDLFGVFFLPQRLTLVSNAKRYQSPQQLGVPDELLNQRRLYL